MYPSSAMKRRSKAMACDASGETFAERGTGGARPEPTLKWRALGDDFRTSDFIQLESTRWADISPELRFG